MDCLFDISELFVYINKVKRLYKKALYPVMKKYMLTENEIDVMMFLCNNPRFNSIADITEYRALTKSHVSLSADNLEGKGYLIKTADENDKRLIRLALTEKASEITDAASAAQKNLVKLLSANLKARDLLAIRRILLRVKKSIDNEFMDEEPDEAHGMNL